MAEGISIEQWVKEASLRLKQASIGDARQEARFALEEALGLSLTEQYRNQDHILLAQEHETLDEIIRRRCQHEPFSSIFGRISFYGQTFHLNEACLAPRPETELLVEVALTEIEARNLCCWRIAELCCGSGAPGLSVLYKLQRRGIQGKLLLLDIEPRALQQAKENAELLGLETNCTLVQGDLFPPLDSGLKFDIIMVNPPYIKTEDIDHLMPDVREYETHLALDGGADGLDFYRRIADGIAPFLAPQASLFMEHGHGQREAIKTIFEHCPAQTKVHTVNDYSGLERIVAVNYR